MDPQSHVPRTPEVASIVTMLTPQVLVLGSAIFAIVLVALWALFNRTASKRGGDLLLVGPPDAGKTAILSQLAFKQTLPTQTSMQNNTATVTLSNKKSFHVIDVPGHPRLRGQFEEHLATAKVVAFVVDASTISRNGPASAEHLHQVLHALSSMPPSQRQPTLLILAHKSDLLKATSSNSSPHGLAVNRVKAILERELEKRRVSQSGGINIEGLGEEGERTDMGGLECGEKEGAAFKFDEWDGGHISFLGTSVAGSDSEKDDEGRLESLWDWMNNNM